MKNVRVFIVSLAFCLTSTGCLRAITLDEVLARTLENNPEIRAARLQLEEAAGRRLVLRATGLPDIRVNVPAGVQGGKRSGERSVQPFAFGQGAFTQPLFNAGLPATFRRAQFEVLIAEQRLNVAALEQLHGARLAFYSALYQDSLGELERAQGERFRANAQTQSDRLAAGKSDRAAVASARVLEQGTTPRFEAARRLSGGARLQLAEAMGQNPGAQLPKATGALAYAPLDFDVETETRAALEQRTDLRLARLLVRAARDDERIAEAGYYPQIVATISGTY
ncbi:MAG: TolC family protein, partial [Verrucomicrobiota bacterium]|nr:TolC family protein [Verrucomicrobiota bacterium]